MAEYIEREAALGECDWYANEFCECEYAIMPLKGALENLPAADVRPVMRGKWISHDFVSMGKGRYTGSVECSVCHRFLPMKERFCPSCGADMRQCPEDEAADEMASVRWWLRREES